MRGRKEKERAKRESQSEELHGGKKLFILFLAWLSSLPAVAGFVYTTESCVETHKKYHQSLNCGA